MQNGTGMKWFESFNAYRAKSTLSNAPLHAKTEVLQKGKVNHPIETAKTQEVFHVAFVPQPQKDEEGSTPKKKALLFDDEFIEKNAKNRKELFMVPRRALDNKINIRSKLILDSEKRFWRHKTRSNSTIVNPTNTYIDPENRFLDYGMTEKICYQRSTQKPLPPLY